MYPTLWAYGEAILIERLSKPQDLQVGDVVEGNAAVDASTSFHSVITNKNLGSHNQTPLHTHSTLPNNKLFGKSTCPCAMQKDQRHARRPHQGGVCK